MVSFYSMVLTKTLVIAANVTVDRVKGRNCYKGKSHCCQLMNVKLCMRCRWERSRASDYLICFFKVPMKWKIEVSKNRCIWKAFKSEEEWCFHLCHISYRSRDIHNFCIMQIRYWWCHKVWVWKSKHKVENISTSNDAKQLELGKHVVH